MVSSRAWVASLVADASYVFRQWSCIGVVGFGIRFSWLGTAKFHLDCNPLARTTTLPWIYHATLGNSLTFSIKSGASFLDIKTHWLLFLTHMGGSNLCFITQTSKTMSADKFPYWVIALHSFRNAIKLKYWRTSLSRIRDAPPIGSWCISLSVHLQLTNHTQTLGHTITSQYTTIWLLWNAYLGPFCFANVVKNLCFTLQSIGLGYYVANAPRALTSSINFALIALVTIIVRI
jgi:hypothetical protein